MGNSWRPAGRAADGGGHARRRDAPVGHGVPDQGGYPSQINGQDTAGRIKSTRLKDASQSANPSHGNDRIDCGESILGLPEVLFESSQSTWSFHPAKWETFRETKYRS